LAQLRICVLGQARDIPDFHEARIHLAAEATIVQAVGSTLVVAVASIGRFGLEWDT
jgi:hypothetical protein